MSDPTPASPAPSELPPGESRFKVTAADLRNYLWQKLLAAHPTKECWSYYEVFSKQAQELGAKGDTVGNRVYSFLQVVSSFLPKTDDMAEPYDSMWKGFNGRRALNPDDLVDEDLKALEEIMPEIDDPEMRARVADVVWIRCKNFKAAQIAVAAFLESAQRLRTADLWPRFTERLERAAQIAARKGFEEMEKTVVAAIEGYITEAAADPKSGLLCSKLMSILIKLGEGDAKHYAALAEQLAKDFEQKGDWHVVERYWQRAELWHRRLNDEAAMSRCRVAAAESYVSRSDAGLPNGQPNFGYRAHWMGKGLEALRQAKADPKRIGEVHRQFLALEKQALSEMQTVQLPEIPGMADDEKKAQEAAAGYVAGRPWEEALERFFHLLRPTDTAALKAQVEKQSEETIFDKVVATVVVDRTGKVADTIGATIDGDDAETLRKKMVQQAKTINWPLRVSWCIEPVRFRLCVEHSIRLSDLRFFVEHNPFVPPGHEAMYLRGFFAGFYGDWLVAMHLLVPQVEASIRHVFQQYQVITSTLDAEGHQQEKDLNALLWMPEMEEYFGPDITFDLRGLLIERFGFNLRNESAHGLMPEAAFYQPGAVYLWALLMLMCWHGYRTVKTASDGSEPSPDAPPTAETPP
jgi:hypothetical protein